MDLNKCRITLLIIGIILFLINIFTLIFTIWTTKALAILYYICIFFIFIRYIHFILIETNLNIKCLHKLRKQPVKFTLIIALIFGFFTIFEFVIMCINLSKYVNYWRNCPFVISDLDYSLHYNRRCELYNINYNSRYSYQYICSYDSSKDFEKKELKAENKPEKVICNEVKTLIPNNDVITLFNNEYSKKKQYYCNRSDKPKDYTFASHKDCNQVRYAFMAIFYMFSLIQIYYFCVYIKYLKRKGYNQHENRTRREFMFNRFRNRNLNREAEAMEIRHILNFGRLMNLIRDLININMNLVSSSNCSTEVSEHPNQNDNENLEGNTKNIIIENKEEIIIETDINNYYTDKKKETTDSINLEQIRPSFDMNSEETKIKNQNDTNNNNINNINNQ